MDDSGLMQGIAVLLAAAGIAADGLRLEPCAGGGNNRVYRVDAAGRTLVAKCYYRLPEDTRDRLGAEYSFLEFARKAGIKCVPEPVARDDHAGIALYAFVAGDKISPATFAPRHMEQAQDFFVSLNALAARRLGAHLPDAAESCYTIADHMALVQARIDRLAMIPATDSSSREAIVFAGELRARWLSARARLESESVRRGMDPRAVLPTADRCISPSDFGFHNAIEMRDGKVAFVDFEYAGWDDPAKTVSDFFLQPAVPVPPACFDSFLASALRYSPNADMLAERTRRLLPLFRMKWCCIVMNDFLPAMLSRRKFADPALAEAEHKRAQLGKARRIFEFC